MHNKPLITIITITYNAELTIENTILSIINQTYSNIEYIIIDGGSTDGTIDIIKKYENKISKWISEPDKGIYDAMNKGIKMATGEWINFMNAGDTFYHTNTIDMVFSNNVSNYDVVYGGVNMKYENFDKTVWPKHKISRNHPMPFNHQSVFVRTTLYKMNLFDTTYRYAADYNFFCKIYKIARYKEIDQIIANYSVDGVSSTNGIAVNKERIKSNPCIYTYYLHALYYRNWFIKSILNKLGCKKFINTLRKI